MRIITTDDFIETYAKLVQRGSGFLLSKFRFRSKNRTLSAFDRTAVNASNWWLVPGIRQRWNRMITGDENSNYENYVVDKYFEGSRGIKLLSLGAGSCSHEINFASHDCFSLVTCIDLAGNLLEKGRIRSHKLGLKNMEFLQGDVHRMRLEEEGYDMILFHASLHHFRDINGLIGGVVRKALKDDGILVINEYVGPDRLQFPSAQIKAVNQALGMIPGPYRSRYLMKARKRKVSGPGILRMYLADPSEARESERIMGVLKKEMEVVEIKPYGGNVLMLALKDIAHNFMEEGTESRAILEELFDFEDEYLENAQSDFVFAVYRKRKQ